MSANSLSQNLLRRLFERLVGLFKPAPAIPLVTKRPCQDQGTASGVAIACIGSGHTRLRHFLSGTQEPEHGHAGNGTRAGHCEGGPGSVPYIARAFVRGIQDG